MSWQRLEPQTFRFLRQALYHYAICLSCMTDNTREAEMVPKLLTINVTTLFFVSSRFSVVYSLCSHVFYNLTNQMLACFMLVSTDTMSFQPQSYQKRKFCGSYLPSHCYVLRVSYTLYHWSVFKLKVYLC